MSAGAVMDDARLHRQRSLLPRCSHPRTHGERLNGPDGDAFLSHKVVFGVFLSCGGHYSNGKGLLIFPRCRVSHDREADLRHNKGGG